MWDGGAAGLEGVGGVDMVVGVMEVGAFLVVGEDEALGEAGEG
jgi:hypothetical protein